MATDKTPPTSTASVLGSDLVQSLKSELNSMSGMASGTHTLIRFFCTVVSSSAPASPSAGRKPNAVLSNATMIPAAYARITVPIFCAQRCLLNNKMMIIGKIKYPAMSRYVLIISLNDSCYSKKCAKIIKIAKNVQIIHSSLNFKL